MLGQCKGHIQRRKITLTIKLALKNQSADSDLKSKQKTCLTIGTFDGVHLGHQKVLEHLLAISKSNNLLPTVLTFSHHPKLVLKKDPNIKLINSLDERIRLINQQGISNVVVQHFDESFAKLTADEFVEGFLVKKLNVGTLCMGYNHRFGKNREGGFAQIQKLGEQFNFSVFEIPKEEINQCGVSSTKIREALSEGNLEIANSCLGYSYQIEGVVVTGKNIGKKLGYPTANLSIENPLKLIPKNGVYVVQSEIGGQKLNGLMNIGLKPTFNEKERTIEVHYLDYEGDLYGKKITVSLLKFMRNEQKFDTKELLKKQIQQDEDAARFFLRS